MTEAPVIGNAVRDGAIEWPAAPLRGNPGFQLRHLAIAPGYDGPAITRQQPEVWLVQAGCAQLTVAGAQLDLQAGDVFTVPIGAPRALANRSSQGCELYVVHGTDSPVSQLG
ncbi:MAG: cupin domain-containing protein [Pseudomonadota bacterium]